MPTRPPRLARWIASLTVPATEREFLLGDLEEQFSARGRRDGDPAARRWYWRQAIRLWRHARRPRRRPVHAATIPARGDSLMRHLLADLRFAMRLLARQPAYAAIAVLSLALAIGANGIVYGLVDGLVLRPFPFPDADRLVSVGSTFPKLEGEEGFIEQHSTLEIEDLRQARSLRHVTSFDIGNRAVSNGTDSTRVLTALVLDDPIAALGLPPRLGRGFTREELLPGGPQVAIISHRLWTSLYGRDLSILSRPVQVNGASRTVVGVMADGPTLLGTDLWIPWGGDRVLSPRNRRQFTVIARLAPGATLDEANEEMAVLAARTSAAHRAQFPEYEGWRLRVATWTEAVTGQARGVAALLLAAGGVVLLIACANSTGLVLARLNARRRELAVRVALGAAGWQVTRLLVVESLVVAGLAGAIGLAVAHAGVGPVMSLMPDEVASIAPPAGINLRVIVFCIAIATVAAMITALVPAWQTRRADPQQALRGGQTGGRARQRTRQTLVVIEMALAVVLLVGAGLLLRSFVRIQQIDPGFRSEGVLTMRLTLAWERYGAPGASRAFFNDLVERLGALPGVTAAAAASQFPPAQSFTIQFRVVDAPAVTGTLPNALVTVMSPDLFRVLDRPMRHGRALGPGDRSEAAGAVVVNEAFMHRYLQGRPTGRLEIGPRKFIADVVGVVADARNNSLTRPAAPEVFGTIDQVGADVNQYFLLVKTTGDPLTALPEVRRVMSAMDPTQPLYMIQTMDRAMAGSLYAQRVALTLVGVFAIGALIVATIGVYGIVAFWVSARTREIGIRVALGASARQIGRLVIGQTARLVAIGLTVGLAGGVGLGIAASSLLYDTAAADPIAIGSVIAVLGVSALVASYVPSRRAMAVDPVNTLRTE